MNNPNRKLAYTRYKLVTQDYTTNGNTKWKDKGKWLTVTATGKGNQLCSADVVHFYDHPVLAVIANPRHADISNPRLLLIKCSRPINHDGLKGGSKSAKAVKEIPLPVLTTEQKAEFSIRVSFEVMTELKIDCPKWFSWAADWFSGKDRSSNAANAAAYAAADAAANAADAYAANAAANAATDAATDAANAADAYAAYAAYAANAAAYAAAYAAADAAGKMFMKVLKAMKLDMKIKISIVKPR